MAQKRYGPTRGAGVAIIELEGEKGIEPGALGWAGYAGLMEKGPVGELIVAQNKKIFEKKCGGLISDSTLPDCASDYYSLANGTGGLLLIRVTDGNEAQATMTLYARIGAVLTPMGTLKAKNGGRWGGKRNYLTNDLALITDLTNITLDTGTAMETDEWVGGHIELEDVPNTRYPIVGNDDAGVITVASDQTMLDDYNALSGSSLRYYLSIANDEKALSIEIEDGEENPDTEFALSVYVDGGFVKKYGNLNTNPTSGRYWVDIINDDGGNDEITAVDLWTGAHIPSVRPANYYGIIDTVTATVLTSIIHDFTINSPVGAGNPTFAFDSTDDDMIAQKITITMTSATEGTAVSDKFGSLGTVTLGTSFVPNNKWTPEFTVTAGATPLVATDTLVINYKPFIPDSLIGGYCYPDKVNAKATRFRIVDNDHDSITVASGSDMTVDGAASDEFMVTVPLEMEGGRDGNADIADTDYTQQAWDVGNSPFNRIYGKNMGLVKFSTPGVTSTAVQKAGVAYAEAKNHQYRYEIPSNIVTENDAIAQINDTLGRSDFAVVAFPSYGKVPDPDSKDGKLKTIPVTGMVHGREARIAADYDGYHKAEAGIDAKLPRLLDIPTGDALLNEEQLNPVGVTVIKKSTGGNFIIWGDRTLSTDPTWKWKHQREQMSYYEHVLQESFDWLIFMINDKENEKLALAALKSFFIPEWLPKRAIRGDTFDQAAIIKLDDELNTDATRAAGDMIAEVKLRLADTVERFIIRIGKQGIFDSVG
jgi:hypothetical protein